MIKLSKETKVKLLKCIQQGTFDSKDFQELTSELHRHEIEIINSANQVRYDEDANKTYEIALSYPDMRMHKLEI